MSSTLKRMPAGLYSHGAPPPAEYHAAYSGGWIQVPWSAIEPASGHYDPTPITRAVSEFVTAGYRDVRLRPMLGASSPAWALDRYGFVEVKDIFQTAYHKIPRWWDPEFMLSYDLLMRFVNGVVGPLDTVIEVAASACMSVFAEPFNRNLSDKTSVANMIEAGYTWEKDHAAMSAMIRIHAHRFGRTRTGLACNPWGNPETHNLDVAATLALAQYARGLMGGKLVLENNSLDAPAYNGDVYLQMYDGLHALGKPLAFQTRANDRLHDPAGMIDYACSLGASAIETERTPPFTVNDATLFAEQLRAQVRTNR